MLVFDSTYRYDGIYSLSICVPFLAFSPAMVSRLALSLVVAVSVVADDVAERGCRAWSMVWLEGWAEVEDL